LHCVCTNNANNVRQTVTLYLGLIAYTSKGMSDLRKSFLYPVA
jgi:hypothetical protein